MTEIPPPERIDDPPLTLDAASGLMADLGFVAFRTSPSGRLSDSCLMVMLRNTPTRRHFDPEAASFWTVEDGRGQVAIVDESAPGPISRPFSWGRIRIVDRFGARNSFVTFGGWLTGQHIESEGLLLVFGSPVPILRMRGHSQRQDPLADEVLAFFGRIVPQLWTPGTERTIGRVRPEVLWAAFLLHDHERFERSPSLLDAAPDAARIVRRELRAAERALPAVVLEGEAVLGRLWAAEQTGGRPASASLAV